MTKKLFLYPHERLLFEGHGWALIHNGSSKVYATHAECTISYEPDAPDERGPESSYYGEYCWVISEEMPPKCNLCDVVVPDTIQALGTLYWKGVGDGS